MNSILLLKNLVQNIPYFPGSLFKYVPYNLRLGNVYQENLKLINDLQLLNSNEKLKFLIRKLDSIVNFASSNIPFYQNLYGRSNIRIKCLSDFHELPIVYKKDVREYTKNSKGSFLLNTGGSSGEPLSFYVDKSAWAREWAHMHYVWGKAGYKSTDLMITILGKNIGRSIFRFNPVHNEFRLNPYINYKHHVKEFIDFFLRYNIKYFQGYPSSIFNFLKEIESFISIQEKRYITNQIKCCFLSSEFPIPYMVDYIKKVWGFNCVSWYGHSEMCVLAYDVLLSGDYIPLHSYGYAEEQNGTLIGTSFNNFEMPLIRYSTDDGIEAIKDENGLLEKFRITKGRVGDFIVDKQFKNIPLTSFLFGRHHRIFEIADFVQIKQLEPGFIEFWITLKNSNLLDLNSISVYFDLSNINIEFCFKVIDSPILTKSGKFKLML